MSKIKEKLLKKSNLWHLGAVVLFLAIAGIYFYPAFQGYSVKQGDVVNWVGASQEIQDYRDSGQEIGWTNVMFSGMPSIQISTIFAGRDIIIFLRNAFTLWLPSPVSYLFLYLIGFYILGISLKVKPLVRIISAIGFGLSSYMIIIIEAGHNTKALAIGFAPMVIAGLIFAYRWKNWWLGVGLSALFMGFELVCNHIQITYYMGFVIAGVMIVELVRYIQKGLGVTKFLKITGGILVGFLLALGVNYGNIQGTNEYGKYTTRGGTELTITPDGQSNEEVITSGLDREYVTAWSYGRGETFTFLVPNFKGGETMAINNNDANDAYVKEVPGMYKDFVKNSNQYWGDQPFTSGPVYLGIIVVFLALLGLIYSKDRLKWALFAITVLTVMLSWGKNFMGLTDIFLDYVPGYNKFRAVTIILVVAQLCVPFMGMLFLNRLFKEREQVKENIKPFLIASGATVFLLLLFLAVPTALNSFISTSEAESLNSISDPALYEQWSDAFNELQNTRVAIFRRDVLRSLAFLVLAIGIIFAFIKKLVNEYTIGGVLVLLILIDMVGVDRRYLNTEKKGRHYVQWTETWKQKYPYTAGAGDLEIFNREVQKNPNLLFAVDSALNATNFEGMESAEKKAVSDWVKFRTLSRYTNYRVFDLGNAFNSSYASYFHKSIGGYHGAKLGRYQELIEFHLGKGNPSVLDMLNTRYQIVSRPGQNGVDCQFVKENPTAMGNAWFTKSVKVVGTADEEILALEATSAATMIKKSPNFEVLVNDEPFTGNMYITGNEKVEVISALPGPAGTVVIDTIQQSIPVKEAEAFDLSLIPGQNPGTWNWAYDARLDSTFDKILTVTTAGREGWDPRKETIVREDFMANVSQESYSGEGTIVMSSYNPEEMVYASSSNDKQLAVFSEIYYPDGWKAYVDNQEVPILRVNYTLRGIEVPAGEHRIEFIYESESFKRSGIIAWISSILILILLGTGVYFQLKSKELDSEESTEEKE